MSSRKVPKSRKTPIEHLVHDHNRSGTHVRKYHRGEGDAPYVAPPRPQKAARQGANLGLGPLYNVTIEYVDHGPEIFAVRTNNSQAALNVSLNSSRASEAPKIIILKRR